MSTPAPIQALLGAISALHAATPVLRDFMPWPSDIAPTGLAPHPIPALPLIARTPGAASPDTAPLLSAVHSALAHMHWHLLYSKDEVGAHFLSRYGFCEVIGPRGHFTSSQTRVFFCYFGSGLWYPRHEHAAEELYFVISGSARLSVDAKPDLIAHAGDARLHGPHEPHALETTDNPMLALIYWRGPGLDDEAHLS